MAKTGYARPAAAQRLPPVPAVHIITRTTKAGERRYLVRYRLGGRESRLLHGGLHDTPGGAGAPALDRRELAAHRVPDLRLAQPAEQVPLTDIADRYLATRIDATDRTLSTYRQAVAKLGPLGTRDPGTLTVADVQEWITRTSAETLTPATVRKYLDALRQVFDLADVEPNPARSRTLRLPRAQAEEASPHPWSTSG